MKNINITSLIFWTLILQTLITSSSIYGQWEKMTVGKGKLPSVAIDANDSIHLCYLTKSREADVIYSLLKDDQWLKDTLTSNEKADQVAITVDSSGTIHIIYSEVNSMANTFWLKYIHSQEEGWSTPETILSNERGFWSLVIKTDSDSTIHIAYLEGPGLASNGSIYYINNAPGDWFISEVTSWFNMPAYDDISMVIDSGGYAHIASYFLWLSAPCYLTNSPDGQWSGPNSIQSNWNGGQLEGLIIDIALDPDYKPHICYVGSDDGILQNHRYAEKPFAAWTSEHVDDGALISSGQAIATDPDGVIHIAYYHWETGELRYTMNYSGSWPHETLDTPGADYGRRVDMETDQYGFVHLCYEDSKDIFYATNLAEIPAPNIVLSPAILDFGTVDTSQSPTKPLYIKNEGVLDLHIFDIYISGGDSIEFSVVQLCDSIIPGDSCLVPITFSPDLRGDKQTVLYVISNDPDTPVKTAAITGRTPYPVIYTDPDRLDFDLTEVGETDTLVLTIGNSGDRALLLDSLRLAGEASTEFEILYPCAFVPPLNECKIAVVFIPITIGVKNATLKIFSNDLQSPVYDIPLSASTPAAILEIENNVIDFGNVPVGNLAFESVTLHNSGQKQLNISSVSLSGTNSSLFRLANNCGAISPGGSCTLKISFFPKSTGLKTASLSIASNDPGQPTAVISLRGTGGEIQPMSYIFEAEEAIMFTCMDTLSNGNFIVGGELGTAAYLAQVSSEGMIVWQKVYTKEYSGGSISCVREFWDGGFIISGSASHDYRWICRLDQEGEIIWQKRAEEDYWGSINDLKITSDSAIIAVGSTYPHGPSASDMWIGKFDSLGTVIWQKLCGENDIMSNERGNRVLETNGGDYIVSGTGKNHLHQHPDGGYLYAGQLGHLWKFKADGSGIWQKQIIQTPRTGFRLTYFSPGDESLWQKAYPIMGFPWAEISDLTITKTGDIVLVGNCNTALGPSNMTAMRLTKTGDIIWKKQFMTTKDHYGADIREHSSGIIAITGSIKITTYDYKGWLSLISPDGKLEGCATGRWNIPNITIDEEPMQFNDVNPRHRVDDVAFIDETFTVASANALGQEYCNGIALDADYDGVSNTEESGPDGQNFLYDGNNDEIPDLEQDNAASFHNFDSSAYVTMSTDPGIHLMNVTAADNPSPDDQPVDIEFPLGFFDFSIAGMGIAGSASVSLYVPEDFIPDTYYKFGKEYVYSDPWWYEFVYDDASGAEFQSNRIVLHFIDGVKGDDDLSENAFITDIGGPGTFSSSIGVDPLETSSGIEVFSNYPNPFHSSTTISFVLNNPDHIRIEVYDLWGRNIKTLLDEEMSPGQHNVVFEAETLPSGIYYYSIKEGRNQYFDKMILLK